MFLPALVLYSLMSHALSLDTNLSPGLINLSRSLTFAYFAQDNHVWCMYRPIFFWQLSHIFPKRQKIDTHFSFISFLIADWVDQQTVQGDCHTELSAFEGISYLYYHSIVLQLLSYSTSAPLIYTCKFSPIPSGPRLSFFSHPCWALRRVFQEHNFRVPALPHLNDSFKQKLKSKKKVFVILYAVAPQCNWRKIFVI